MNKFTKGIWMSGYDGVNNCVDVIDSAGNRICEFFDCLMWHEDEAEDKANIRLIASAPEMYALIASIAHLPDEQCMISPMIHEARGLIARIDGEEAKA